MRQSDAGRLEIAANNKIVDSLHLAGEPITVDHLRGLLYYSRFRIADQMWFMCTAETRKALLADEHEAVQRIALESQKDECARLDEFEPWFLTNHVVPEGVCAFETYPQGDYVWDEARIAYFKWIEDRLNLAEIA